MNDVAMKDPTTLDAYGALIEPATLKVQRLLPGPVERVWDYLTKSELRRHWLAVGEMDLKPGATFELVWRNDELTSPPGARPEGFGAEHRAECRILDVEPPFRLRYEWPGVGEVAFELAPRGQKVLLTLVHSRIPNRKTTVGVSTGWHAHLDLLATRLAGGKAEPFWDTMARLRKEYDRRIPAEQA